jgi:hypothetical protein
MQQGQGRRRVHGLDIIRHEHRELVRLTEAVMQAAAGSEICIDAIAAARHALGQLITRHISHKQLIITATLQNSADPAHQRLAWRFTEDLMKLRQSTSEHYGIWTMARLRADPREYRMAVRTQHRMLKARIVWEETEVFPIVAKLLAGTTPIELPAQRRTAGIR